MPHVTIGATGPSLNLPSWRWLFGYSAKSIATPMHAFGQKVFDETVTCRTSAGHVRGVKCGLLVGCGVDAMSAVAISTDGRFEARPKQAKAVAATGIFLQFLCVALAADPHLVLGINGRRWIGNGDDRVWFVAVTRVARNGLPSLSLLSGGFPMYAVNQPGVLPGVACTARFRHLAKRLERSVSGLRVLCPSGMRHRWIETAGIAPMAVVTLKSFLVVHVANQAALRYVQTCLIPSPKLRSTVAQDTGVQIVRGRDDATLGETGLSAGCEDQDAR